MAKKIQTRKATLSKPHVIIDAGPGCGKTTTMIAALNIMKGKKPSWYDQATQEQKDIWNQMEGVYHSIGFQAFNKSIAEELKDKCPANVESKTFHAFGLSILRANGFKVKGSGDNVQYIVKDAMGYDKDDSMKREDFDLSIKIKKFVSLMKNNLVEPSDKVVLQIAEQNNIEVNGEVAQITKYSKLAMDKVRRAEPGQFIWIDFDDMLWLPIVLDLDCSESGFDLLVCDESQDLNPIQHELVFRSGNRLICVGDPRQAIYGFRGADSKSMTTLEDMLAKTKRGVIVLPLQTSFRLPKSAVKNVNEYAPDLKPLDDAIEGTIKECYIDEAEPKGGDLIVSRINANIFSLAFQLVRKNIPVRVQGREFGNQMIKIINDTCSKGDPIELVFQAIATYDIKERERLAKKTFSEKLIDVHSEKIACLQSLCAGCKDAGQVIDIIQRLVNDKTPRSKVVLLSTVHKAKGLEADNVWFLDPQLVPHPMAKTDKEKEQEYNLKFVAETRHKETLTYVYPRNDEDTRDEEEGREIRIPENKGNDEDYHFIAANYEALTKDDPEYQDD